MTNYQEVTVKVTNSQLNKLKSVAKNKAETILRLNKKNFEDEELPHELFLTIRQRTKVRNAFANNMSTEIKLTQPTNISPEDVPRTSPLTYLGCPLKILFVHSGDVLI